VPHRVSLKTQGHSYLSLARTLVKGEHRVDAKWQTRVGTRYWRAPTLQTSRLIHISSESGVACAIPRVMMTLIFEDKRKFWVSMIYLR
jgi:hypothetical protein